MKFVDLFCVVCVCANVFQLWYFSDVHSVFIAHENNAHCIATALNSLSGALFSLCQLSHVQIADKLKEFLAVSNSFIVISLSSPH